MGKYIDTKYLFKCNTCTHCRNGRCNTYCEHFECYTPDLNLIPTADVVEVVRCKDCKHWGGVTFGYICRRFSGTYIRNETRECDFCSFGERKDGKE